MQEKLSTKRLSESPNESPIAAQLTTDYNQHDQRRVLIGSPVNHECLPNNLSALNLFEHDLNDSVNKKRKHDQSPELPDPCLNIPESDNCSSHYTSKASEINDTPKRYKMESIATLDQQFHKFLEDQG